MLHMIDVIMIVQKKSKRFYSIIMLPCGADCQGGTKLSNRQSLVSAGLATRNLWQHFVRTRIHRANELREFYKFLNSLKFEFRKRPKHTSIHRATRCSACAGVE